MSGNYTESEDFYYAHLSIHKKLLESFNAGSKNNISSKAKKEQLKGFSIIKHIEFIHECPADKSDKKSSFLQAAMSSRITTNDLINKYNSNDNLPAPQPSEDTQSDSSPMTEAEVAQDLQDIDEPTQISQNKESIRDNLIAKYNGEQDYHHRAQHTQIKQYFTPTTDLESPEPARKQGEFDDKMKMKLQ